MPDRRYHEYVAMELPVVQQSDDAAPEALVRAVQRARTVLARTVAEETILAFGLAYTNGRRPGVRLANHVAEVDGDTGIGVGDVAAGIEAHFRERGATCHFVAGKAARLPPALADCLSVAGFAPRTRIVLAMARYRPLRRASLQIIPARAAYRELGSFYRTMAAREPGAADDRRLADDLTATWIDRLDEPRLTLFLGRMGQRPVGAAGVLSLGNIGVIDAACTDPDCRGQGVAAALMAHTLDHCSRAGFERVLVERSDGCPAIGFYRSLGFEEAARCERYVRAGV